MKTYQELLREARAGGRGAFGELTARFRPMALTVARRHLGQSSLAEDAVQEAFLTAYLKLDQLRNPTAFPSWLKAIVYSACRTLRKGNVHEVPLEEAAAEIQLRSGADGPEEHCVRWQTREMVSRTLDALPETAREACRMRYEQGLPYRYIAEVLGVPEGTVKRRLHDARTAIMRSITDREPEVIRIGYLPISDHLLAMVSHAKGDCCSCRVALRKFLSWDALEHALRDGTVDGAFVMVPMAMHLRNQGVDLSYVLNGHRNGSAVVGRFEKFSSSDLPGMRLGLPHEFSTHRMLLHSLMRGAENLENPEGAVICYAGPSFANAMFQRGDLDAFFCAEPWSSLCESRHGGTVLLRSADVAPGHACCGLVVRNSFARKHGEVVEAYVRSVKNAAKRTIRKPGDAADIQFRYTGVPRDVAQRVIDAGHVDFQGLRLDRTSLKASMTLVLRAGMLRSPCNLDAFICDEYY